MTVLKVLKAVPSYFTVWNLVIVACNFVTFKYIDILLTCTIILAVSTYMLYVRPGYFRMILKWASSGGEKEEFYIVSGLFANILHILLHVVPLVYVALKYGAYYRRRPLGSHTILALLLFFLYLKMVKMEEVYDVEFEHLSIVALAATAGYVVCKSVVQSLVI